jgi:hypothetical protein
LVFVGPILLGPLFALVGTVSKLHQMGGYSVPFYGLDVPILLLIGLLALYFGVWNVLGILRKFTLEGEPLFSRKAALLYLLGYETVALGLFWPHLPDRSQAIYPLWLLVSLVPAMMIPLGSLRTFNDYLERWNQLSVHSNLTLSAGLLLLWVAFSAVVAIADETSLAEFAYHAAGILSFCAVLLLLLELHVVYQPVYSKIGVLLGFLAVLYLILPPILAATMAAPSLHYHSFVGFFFYLFDSSGEFGTAAKASVLVVNALLGVLLALPIARRYASVRLLRHQMNGSRQMEIAYRPA